MNVTTNTRYAERYTAEMQYHRGDIVWVDFGDTVGSEQGDVRPAVIIQNEVGNKHSPCVIVAIMTSREKKPMITHVGINPSTETGLTKPTTVMTEQIRTIDKSRILSWAGKLGDRMMNCIDRAILASIGIENNAVIA